MKKFFQKTGAGFWCFLLLALMELPFFLNVSLHLGYGCSMVEVSNFSIIALKVCDVALIGLFIASAILCYKRNIKKLRLPMLFMAAVKAIVMVAKIIVNHLFDIGVIDCIAEDFMQIVGDVGLILMLLCLSSLCRHYDSEHIDRIGSHPKLFCFFWAIALVKFVFGFILSEVDNSDKFLFVTSVLLAFLYFWISAGTKPKKTVYVLLFGMVALAILAILIGSFLYGNDIFSGIDPEKDWGAGLDWGKDYYWNTNSHSVEHKFW